MSNNLLNPDKYKNCIKHDGKMNLHGKNRLNEDGCEKIFRTKQSESPEYIN